MAIQLFFFKDRTGHKTYKTDLDSVAEQKTIQLHSAGAAILIYCRSALNCGEGCQQAGTQPDRAEAVTEMALQFEKGLT